MSDTPQTTDNSTESLPADMQQLQDAIAQLPAESRRIVEPVLQRVLDSTRRRRKILNLVQDALGQLRLDMKYLMFDLEATRRERDEFRTRLDDGKE